MTKLAVIAIALVSVVSCKKDKDKDPASTDKVADTTEAADPAVSKDMPAAFLQWDVPARAKAWQGAWLTEEMAGFAVALEVKGSAATQWDGKAEKHLEFSLESPCSAKLTEKSGGGSSSTITTFTLKAGKLVAGLGDAGSRKGPFAIACVSNQILTLDNSGCTAWSNDFGHWKSEKGTCAIAQKDGKDVFTATVNGHDETLLIDGDAILSDQLAGKSAQSFADFAAAKAARK